MKNAQNSTTPVERANRDKLQKYNDFCNLPLGEPLPRKLNKETEDAKEGAAANLQEDR